MDPLDPNPKAYVDAALSLHGYSLSEQAQAAVVENFARIAAIAATFVDHPLQPHDEMAPVFRPRELR
jgi:hypothetical protein